MCIAFQIIMFQYAVACHGKIKRILVNRKAEIYKQITAEFKLDPQSELTLKTWEGELEDYVDVDDVESLPDECKLYASVASTPKISPLTLRNILNPTAR